MTNDRLWSELSSHMRGRVERDLPLAPLTTYRLGGAAALYVEPVDEDDLGVVATALARDPVDILMLGRGSNVVVSDAGWLGLVVRMGAAFSWVRPGERSGAISAGASTSLPVVANWAARRGLSGLEFFVAIPGSIGGAVRMNAGAHGGATADCLTEARLFDLATGHARVEAVADLGFDYRTSGVGPNDIVIEAAFGLQREDERAIRDRMDAYRKHRAATQPPAVQNAGSVFKNPPGDSAGRLVEAAGLKGFSVGGASVSQLHANFFIAGPDATAQDVFDLVRAVRERVHEASGIDLTPEIHFAGGFDRSS
ncbi:MAG: UDP-N-acetylmuramate dehydrogenase [Actinomycetota bacterium]|nr:UDP-N-acetylmuramate dehydrogenase [Actinomycetota bacterium]